MDTTSPSDEAERRSFRTSAQHGLLLTLLTELNQTERSAALHCRREGRRLGSISPSAALTACALHAERVLADLAEVQRIEQLRTGRFGVVIGSMLSGLRVSVLDRLVDAERSYRATLLGLRHGLDLVRLIRSTADSTGRVELAGFCTRWLLEREPLVAEVERAMTWFAHHPVQAAHRGAVLHPSR